MQTIIDENELLINEVNYIYKSLFIKDPTKTLPKITQPPQKLTSKMTLKKKLNKKA